jgi:predicted alpha/beta-hydrolase family hydrolase
VGDARVTVHPAASPTAWLITSHGAGGGIDARDLAALAAELPARGITVALVEQPWRVAGKKVAPAPKTLDAAWIPVVEALKKQHLGGLPFAVSGRSAGARVACRTAALTGADAAVALAFPLHPPGKPEKSRAAELLGAGVPTLVLQGERDTFGTPEEFPDFSELPGFDLIPVPSGDHSFTVLKRAPVTQEDAIRVIVDGVGNWLEKQLVGC